MLSQLSKASFQLASVKLHPNTEVDPWQIIPMHAFSFFMSEFIRLPEKRFPFLYKYVIRTTKPLQLSFPAYIPITVSRIFRFLSVQC